MTLQSKNCAAGDDTRGLEGGVPTTQIISGQTCEGKIVLMGAGGSVIQIVNWWVR